MTIGIAVASVSGSKSLRDRAEHNKKVLKKLKDLWKRFKDAGVYFNKFAELYSVYGGDKSLRERAERHEKFVEELKTSWELFKKSGVDFDRFAQHYTLDNELALPFIRQVAASDPSVSPETIMALDKRIKEGQDSPTEEVKRCRKAAEHGDANAQFNLGCYYDNGEGVPKNAVEAVKWYRKAAKQGKASAQNNLGCCYDNGEGVPEDTVEAVKWYRKAAEQGSAEAQCGLGLMYADGRGVPKDDAEAVKWYRKAADQGLADAQSCLGCHYAKGEGVPKDDVEAAKWWRKAAKQGNANAQTMLDRVKLSKRGKRAVKRKNVLALALALVLVLAIIMPPTVNRGSFQGFQWLLLIPGHGNGIYISFLLIELCVILVVFGLLWTIIGQDKSRDESKAPKGQEDNGEG